MSDVKTYTPEQLAEGKKHLEMLSEKLDQTPTFQTLRQADVFYIPQIREVYQDALLEITQQIEPEAVQDYVRCFAEKQSNPAECVPILSYIASKYEPLLNMLLDHQRRKYLNGLWVGSSPLHYASPFWYEGAGAAWRHATHNPQYMRETINMCTNAAREADQCLADPTKSNEYCFRVYQHKVVCMPGLHCPYLRFPLLKCMQAGSLADFSAFTACAKAVPNFEQCQKGFVARDEI